MENADLFLESRPENSKRIVAVMYLVTTVISKESVGHARSSLQLAGGGQGWHRRSGRAGLAQPKARQPHLGSAPLRPLADGPALIERQLAEEEGEGPSLLPAAGVKRTRDPRTAAGQGPRAKRGPTGPAPPCPASAAAVSLPLSPSPSPCMSLPLSPSAYPCLPPGASPTQFLPPSHSLCVSLSLSLPRSPSPSLAGSARPGPRRGRGRRRQGAEKDGTDQGIQGGSTSGRGRPCSSAGRGEPGPRRLEADARPRFFPLLHPIFSYFAKGCVTRCVGDHVIRCFPPSGRWQLEADARPRLRARARGRAGAAARG
jgi:hypothetical protein